ncbi:MAG TPA: hypothetical protein VNV82_24770 [Bryobacteraceae bacterium]|nr:hypothetical protein [Bryobacteraceae bacterium]
MTGQLRIFAGALFACSAFAQLIPPGTAVPLTSKPPVVFINGFELVCSGESFSNTFGSADQVLQANGEVSLFFNICSVSGTPTIEDLGAALGSFLANLHYVGGMPVEQVDVVAHSMGGLVLRSYLSGKQNTSGVFQPPAQIEVRKVVFLATPHFGTGASLPFGLTPQLRELASGSTFLFDLGTWNQGADDLRGVDAIAAAGNGGTGQAVMKGFDDGVVALTSASLQFYQPGRTHVLPYCHVNGGGIVSFAGLCSSSAQGIANINSAMHESAQMIVSFFNGTDAWKNVGVAAEKDPFLSVDGGLIVEARNADDISLPLSSVTAARLGLLKQLNIPSDNVAYTDLFPAGPLSLRVLSPTLAITNSVTLPAGGVEPYTVKAGPQIVRVLPAAATLFPLSLAPGMFVAIYGQLLAAQPAQATGLPFPTQLSDAQVSFNGTPIPLSYASPAQINGVIPDNAASGLATLMVSNGAGKHTVNVFVESALPAIFTLDRSGTGPAAAIKAANNGVVSTSNPLHAGDYVELYATGLGATTKQNGLDYATQQPIVTIGGQDCPVTFAGRAPGYVGLDQINCIVPAVPPVPLGAPGVIVTSGTRSSNVATLAVE